MSDLVQPSFEYLYGKKKIRNFEEEGMEIVGGKYLVNIPKLENGSRDIIPS